MVGTGVTTGFSIKIFIENNSVVQEKINILQESMDEEIDELIG